MGPGTPTQLTSASHRSNGASTSTSNGVSEKSPVSEPDYWCGSQECNGKQGSYGPQSSPQRTREMGCPFGKARANKD